jgi:alpha-tubulin suppressor-like RCC1 family protein
VAVSGITDAVSLWNNGSSYCAVLTTGGVDCWGSNNGLLGNGTTTSDSDVPVAVEGVGGVGSLGGVFSLAADGDGYCAVVSSGAVDCWGDNPYGDLGDGTSTSSDVPVTVSGVGGSGSLGAVVSLVGGSSSYCAALSSGAVSCWGDNLHGELGNGTSTSSDVPVVASGVTMATSIAVDSAESFCAGLSSGGIDCWGFNQNNQLGNSSVIYGPGNLSSSSDVPVAVSGVMTASSLIGGGGSYCALLTAGSVTCWGSAGL